MKIKPATTPEEALRALVAAAQKRAQKMFMRKSTVPLFFLAERADGGVFKLDTEPYLQLESSESPSPLLKNVLVAAARQTYEITQVVRHVVVMEAWIVRAATDQEHADLEAWKERDEGAGISRHPRRFEVISYTAEDQSGFCLQGWQSIVRPAGKRPWLENDLDLQTFDGFEGRFAHMLPKQAS